MGKKNRESNRTIRSSTVTHQQDEIFEYLTKTFNRKDGPIQVEILLFFETMYDYFLNESSRLCVILLDHMSIHSIGCLKKV